MLKPSGDSPGADPDGKEVELKLALAPAEMDRLRRHPAIKHTQLGRPQTKRLRSVYYDTPDHALAKAGISARVRASGAARVQTVKTAGNRASGLFARSEWEVPVDGDTLDPVQLAATGLPLLQDAAVVSALGPVFATEVRRTVYRLGGDGWAVELALDRGAVHAGEVSAPISEAELELIDGPPAHLFALARALVRGRPARLLATSKSERGYALAAGHPPSPTKSKPVPLEAAMTVADAFRAIARNCLHHLLANEASLIETGDAEAVHQMRVALRRLRSALKVFRRMVEGPQLDAMQAEIKWLLDRLGPARDADVFLAEIIGPLLERHPDAMGIQALAERWRTIRDDDLAAARAAVGDCRFTALLLDLGAWVESGDWTEDADRAPLRDGELARFAARVLDKRARKLRKAGGKRLEKLSAHALHRVRIQAKQVRYAGEFFAPLYGKSETKPYLSTLAHAQDLLGEINDIAVAGPRLAASYHLGGEAWAAGMIAGWHEARRPHLLAEADKVWKDVRGLPRFWRS